MSDTKKSFGSSPSMLVLRGVLWTKMTVVHVILVVVLSTITSMASRVLFS